jgi:hypothetical protein
MSPPRAPAFRHNSLRFHRLRYLQPNCNKFWCHKWPVLAAGLTPAFPPPPGPKPQNRPRSPILQLLAALAACAAQARACLPRSLSSVATAFYLRAHARIFHPRPTLAKPAISRPCPFIAPATRRHRPPSARSSSVWFPGRQTSSLLFAPPRPPRENALFLGLSGVPGRRPRRPVRHVPMRTPARMKIGPLRVGTALAALRWSRDHRIVRPGPYLPGWPASPPTSAPAADEPAGPVKHSGPTASP